MSKFRIIIFNFISINFLLFSEVAFSAPGYAISSAVYVGEWRGYGGNPILVKIDPETCTGKSGFNNACVCNEWNIVTGALITEGVANRMTAIALSAFVSREKIEIFGDIEGCLVQVLSITK